MVKVKRGKKETSNMKPTDYRRADIEFVRADVSGVPFCEHGPTLLLERPKGGTVEKFYACAVCRSRKDCSYYRSYDEERRHPTSSQKVLLAKKIMKKTRGLAHKTLYERLKAFRKMLPERRRFCVECSRLVLNAEEAKKHQADGNNGDHQVVNGISDRQLRHPSGLLKLSQNAKKEAQFLFSPQALTFLGEIIKKFSFDGTLCIGTPTVKEYLHGSNCKSFLLDTDYRYAQFWSPRFYAQFNMFNGYFYTELGEKCFRRLLTEVKKLLIVCDPPFGGLIAPLAQTLQKMKKEFEIGGRSCEIVLVSPYFMEGKICNHSPGSTMLDYKVTYNETNGVTGNDNSHVRIFTTLSSELVELPAGLGYTFCDICKRFVAAENRHCTVCNACTSKDGRPYVHCDKCGKCVKSRHRHCMKCQRCHQSKSAASHCPASIPPCQLCGEGGHVWMKCPKKEDVQSEFKEENSEAKVIENEPYVVAKITESEAGAVEMITASGPDAEPVDNSKLKRRKTVGETRIGSVWNGRLRGAKKRKLSE